MANEIADIPPNMVKVYRRLRRWRSTHTGRVPIPGGDHRGNSRPPPNPHRVLPQGHSNAELDEFAVGDNIFKGSVADGHPVLPNFEPHSKVLCGPSDQSLVEVGARPILPRVPGIGVSVSVDIAGQIAVPGADKGFNFPVGAAAEKVIGHTG
jgi:hypothetical protein